MSQPDNTTFDAQVASIKTMADGGLRLTLDLPESAIAAVAWLMEAKRGAKPLHVAVVVNDDGEPRPATVK